MTPLKLKINLSSNKKNAEFFGVHHKTWTIFNGKKIWSRLSLEKSKETKNLFSILHYTVCIRHSGSFGQICANLWRRNICDHFIQTYTGDIYLAEGQIIRSHLCQHSCVDGQIKRKWKKKNRDYWTKKSTAASKS